MALAVRRVVCRRERYFLLPSFFSIFEIIFTYMLTASRRCIRCHSLMGR
jgi:hypothetical protein